MEAAAEIGRNPVNTKHQIQAAKYGNEQADPEPTAEFVSRDKILRRERGQENIHFLYSGNHDQDWQPYPVYPYSCYIVTTGWTLTSACMRVISINQDISFDIEQR